MAGDFTVTEFASIAENNDVFLVSGKTVILGGKLHNNYGASIEPTSYDNDVQILSGDHVSTEYSKFDVKPGFAGAEYTITSEGKLQEK